MIFQNSIRLLKTLLQHSKLLHAYLELLKAWHFLTLVHLGESKKDSHISIKYWRVLDILQDSSPSLHKENIGSYCNIPPLLITKCLYYIAPPSFAVDLSENPLVYVSWQWDGAGTFLIVSPVQKPWFYQCTEITWNNQAYNLWKFGYLRTSEEDISLRSPSNSLIDPMTSRRSYYCAGVQINRRTTILTALHVCTWSCILQTPYLVLCYPKVKLLLLPFALFESVRRIWKDVQINMLKNLVPLPNQPTNQLTSLLSTQRGNRSGFDFSNRARNFFNLSKFYSRLLVFDLMI